MTNQPKFKDTTGNEFTPSELIGSIVKYNHGGQGTIRRVIETRGVFSVMLVCHTYNGVRDWPLDKCTVTNITEQCLQEVEDNSLTKTLEELMTFHHTRQQKGI